MKEKKIIKEIYRLLDGELSPGEREELERYIAGHPEAQQLLKQCENVKYQLESLPKSEVVPEVKAAILNRINTEQQIQQPDWTDVKAVQDFWRRPVVRFGFMFVTGLFAGFFLFSIFKTDIFYSKNNPDNLKGTLVHPRSFEELKAADLVLFENAQIKAACDVRYSPDNVEIHLDIASDQVLTTILEFETDNFSVYNIQPLITNTQSTTLVASGSVNINTVGENKYIVLLYNKKSHSNNIYFRLLQDGREIYKNSIMVNK